MKHIIFPLLIIGVVNSLYSTVPLLLWSSGSIDSQHTLSQTVSGQQFQNLLTSLLSNKPLATESPLSPLITNSAPEVLVVFVTPEIHTDEFIRYSGAYSSKTTGGVFSALKAAVENAPGAIIAPYVESRNIRNALNSMSTVDAASVVVCDEAHIPQFDSYRTATKLSKSQLIARLANADDFMHTNGVTDLVLVSLDATEGQPDHVGEINEALAGKKYVAAFTSAAEEHPLEQEVKQHKRQDTFPGYVMPPQQNPNAPAIPGSRTPSSILQAGYIVLILAIIFFSGLCCLKDIQTPQRFDTGKNIVVAE